MKHLYAGLIVGGIAAALVVGTILVWWFLSLFVSRDAAAVLTGVIILIMAVTAALDYITEQREKV